MKLGSVPTHRQPVIKVAFKLTMAAAKSGPREANVELFAGFSADPPAESSLLLRCRWFRARCLLGTFRHHSLPNNVARSMARWAADVVRVLTIEYQPLGRPLCYMVHPSERAQKASL